MQSWLAMSAATKAATTSSQWSGTTSSDWDVGGTGGNWNNTSYPFTNAGTITFAAVGTARNSVNCNIDVSGITSVSLTSTGYTISGNGSWTFNDGGSITASYGLGAERVSLNMVAQGNLTLATDSGCAMAVGNDDLNNTLTLADNKTLTVSTPVDGSISVYSIIQGNGSLVKTGDGHLYLYAQNTYIGSTTINGGILLAENENVLPSTTDVTIASGATLTLAANQTIGSLAGAGAVQVNGHTLTVGSAVSTAFSGLVTSPTANPGALVKVGSGTMTFTGTCQNNAVNVNGGTLAFNGRMTNNTMTVGSSGTLQGVGTINNLINNGTLSPGNSIGKINLGTYTNNVNSTTRIEIDPTQSDQIAVTGTAVLNNGTVNVVAASGNYTAGHVYTFLTANGLTGSYGSVTDNLAFMDAVLVYDYTAHTVSIRLDESGNYVDAANTDNQRSVASYLDRQKSGASGDFATVLGQLNTLTVPNARLAFDAMGGELFGSLATVGLEDSERFVQNLALRLRSQSMTRGFHFNTAGESTASAKFDESLLLVSRHESWLQGASGWTPWFEGVGVGAKLASNGNSSGLGYSTGGLALGLERWLEEDLLVGVAGGYTNTYTTLDDRSDRGIIDSGHMAVYLERDFGNSYLTGVASYGYNAYDTTRHIDFGTIARTAEAAYSGNSFSFYLEAGQNVRRESIHLQPYTALQYIQLYQDPFTETGADSLNMSVEGTRADALRGFLGTRVLSYFSTGEGRLITLEGRAAWRHEFLNDNRLFDANFAGQSGASFAVMGINADRDAAILGTGLSVDMSKSLKLYANYDLLFSANYAAHAGTGGLQFSW